MLGPYRLAADYIRFQTEYGRTLTTDRQAFCLLPVRDGPKHARWYFGPRDDILDWLSGTDLYQLIEAHTISVFKGMNSAPFNATAIKLWSMLVSAGYNEGSFRSSRKDYVAAYAKAEEESRSIYFTEPFMSNFDTPCNSPILLAMRYGGFTTDTLHLEKYAALSQLDFLREFEQAAYEDAHSLKFNLDRHESQSPLLTSQTSN